MPSLAALFEMADVVADDGRLDDEVFVGQAAAFCTYVGVSGVDRNRSQKRPTLSESQNGLNASIWALRWSTLVH